MGNTKHITIEGRLRPLIGDPSEIIKREARAERVTIATWTEDGVRMAFGAVLTTSMHDCVPALAELLDVGTITKVDLDWSDASVYEVAGGRVVQGFRYDMSDEAPRGLRP